MAWKPTGQPTVRQQRDKWVVRVDGIDTETGKRRPRQLGTFASRRVGAAAATSFAAAGEIGGERGTVGQLVEQWAAGRVDVSAKTRLQYEWAGRAHRPRLGAIRVDRLERDDVARWLDEPRRRRRLRPAEHPDLPHGAACRLATPSTAASSAAARRHASACHGRSPSPTASARPRRGPRTSCSASSPRSATTAGPHRSASACSTGCAAASCSGCAGRPST